tara:strand:- start:659 stop:1072 length:414 start_codon:yes stop_codon:yes gene_type:complete
MNNSTLHDIQFFDLQVISDHRGEMFILQQNDQVKFQFVRTFVVKGKKDILRGHHSHKQCNQLMIVLNGKLEVVCKDGSDEISFMLESSDKALLLPPGIWSHQVPREDNTIFGVWCDRPYEEEDYIRDWDEFLTYRSL